MPAPSDINDRVAEAKAWTWRYVRSAVCAWVGCNKVASPDCCDTCDLVMEGPQPWGARVCLSIEWTDPSGKTRLRPNFAGTLRGVAGMMRELNNSESTREDDCNFVWGFDQHKKCYYVECRGSYGDCLATWESPPEHPGGCVGEALLSVLGKEAADGSEA